MTPDQPQHHQVIAGRYRLGGRIGSGGFGQVFEAVDLRLEREVAVKLVSIEHAESIDPAVVRRFVDEARTGARFTHRHAVTVFDAGRNDDYLYLVTELVRGVNLADHLAQHGPLSTDAATRVADQTLQALDAAHRAGIVHRDVKPSNVLLDERGDVKLADFGIAKRLDDLKASVTSTGQMMGTPRYVAPERTAGDPATPATDLYAVGVVLFEMLTGRPPYDGDSPIAVALAHRDAAIPDVVQWRPDTPRELSAAIGRALAKDPAERFADAGSMRDGLVHFTDASPRGGPPVDEHTRRYATAGAAATGGKGRGGGDDATRALADDGARRRPPFWWWFAAAALIGVAGWAFVALDDDSARTASVTTSTTAPATAGDRASPPPPAVATSTTSAPPSTTMAPTTSTTTSSTTTTTTTTTTTPPTTTTAPPLTFPSTTPISQAELESLIDWLAADPGRAGDRGEHLLRELEKVSDRNGTKRVDRASKTIERTIDWVCDGSLDRAVASDAFDLLTDVITESDIDSDAREDVGDTLSEHRDGCPDNQRDDHRGNGGDDDNGGGDNGDEDDD